MSNLRVWFHQTPIGALTMSDNGRWEFQYDKDWISKNLFAVSPYLPLTENLTPDLAHNKTVEWFFDNLLPEGLLRKKLAEEARIIPSDTWAFLSKYGREGPGALSILPSSETPDNNEVATPITLEELQQFIQKSKDGKPLMTLTGGMSLPGTQEKMTLRIENGKLFLPQDTASSTHILKPENLLYEFCPANEWFSMNLADACGLKTAKSDLISLPNGERVYFVERYDRKKTDNRIERIHQVDLCQACNVPPNYKYESYGGLESKDLFKASNLCVITMAGIRTSLQWLIFNYLIGNNDAHAKNISFFMGTDKLKSTPFYDLLCVESCMEGNNLSMSIGGEIKAGWIEGCHWDAMALESNIDPRALRFIMEQIISKIKKVLPDLTKSPVMTNDERLFVNDKILPVINQRIHFAQDALNQAPILKGELLPINKVPENIIKRILKDNGGVGGGGGM